MRSKLILIALVTLTLAATAHGGRHSGFDVDIEVDGATRPEYFHRGTVYVEALRGRDYAIRITNPMPYRVAVALAVDGLNSINARHTSASRAAKWVLGPYESVTIEGWQVDQETARRFVFTGERDSYGAALGQTENLGVIEAVFFRERIRHRTFGYESEGRDAPRAQAAPPSSESQKRKDQPLDDDYAATGMGDRTDHGIERVEFDLDPDPVASIRIRYEFRQQLVKLGVLDAPYRRTPEQRRERAKGFDDFCPEVE